MPKFSIIIPVYNVAPYLRECLDSVLSQTYTCWEAICVDDGSADGSGAILDEYSAKDSRVRVIHQSNAGVSAARNAALDLAKGEWITFVDADDRIASWRLQFLSLVASDCPDADWIKETQYETNSMARHLGLENATVKRTVAGDEIFLFAWRGQKTNALLVLNSFRRRTVQTLRFPLGVRYAEDDIYELRAANLVHSCAEVGFGGYWYRDDRPGAASRHIDVRDSVRIHKALMQIANEQQTRIEGLKDVSEFRSIFTKTVEKDFKRVFRNWYKAPRQDRMDHHAITKEISNSEYFDVGFWGRCRAGYWLYVTSGLVLPMQIQDLMLRAFGKVKRMIV